MGNVLFHSRSSASKFGGDSSDYLRIHKFLDQSKLYIADWRHRALMHHTLGIALCEQLFGDFYARPSDGQLVCTRTVAEQHILEDLKAIPAPGDFLREMPIRPWMNGLTLSEKNSLQNLKIEGRKAIQKAEADHELPHVAT